MFGRSKNLPEAKKLEQVIEFLTTDHLNAHGGYPYDYIRIGDRLIVATLDDAKDRQRTLIESYAVPDLLEWYDAAVGEWKATRKLDRMYEFREAMWEMNYIGKCDPEE